MKKLWNGYLGFLCLGLILLFAGCNFMLDGSHYITTPQDRQEVAGIQTIVVSPPDSFNVDYIEFSIDGYYVYHDNTTPYSYEWNTRSGQYTNGPHNIMVEMYSIEGTYETDAITVFVNNQ